MQTPFSNSLASGWRPRKRRFGHGSDVHGRDFGMTRAHCLAVRRHFSPIPDSGPSAVVRVLSCTPSSHRMWPSAGAGRESSVGFPIFQRRLELTFNQSE